MVRGLLTNAIDGGTVRITAGLNREDDVLLPRLAACPVGAVCCEFVYFLSLCLQKSSKKSLVSDHATKFRRNAFGKLLFKTTLRLYTFALS